MNFICVADLHIRANAPINRRDANYFETVFDKFNQIIDLANLHEAHIICAGDLFDHIRVSHRVVNEVINSINRLNGRLLLVMGQHDLPNHKTDNIDSSPIKTIMVLPNVTLLGQYPQRFSSWRVYGCSWEQDIPEVKEGSNSILAIHKSITPGEPPFFLKDAVSAEKMLDMCNYRIIVSGDYHESFMHVKDGKVLINCGPMMRQKINEAYCHPACYLINTLTKKVNMLQLKIKEPGDVFLLENTKEKDDSKFREELRKLVESLKKKADNPNYKQIVDIIVNEIKPKESTISKIKELMNNAGRKGT